MRYLLFFILPLIYSALVLAPFFGIEHWAYTQDFWVNISLECLFYVHRSDYVVILQQKIFRNYRSRQ